MTNDEREALVARVRQTLVERDAKYWHPDYDREPLETSHLDWRDLRALCDEVERLTRERDAERQAREVTVGWYDERRAEVLRLTAEVERLREDAARMQDALQSIAGSPLQKALCEGPTRRMEHLTNPCPHCTARKALAARTTGGDRDPV